MRASVARMILAALVVSGCGSPDGAQPSGACTPGASQGCGCDSGARGRAICELSGRWGACACTAEVPHDGGGTDRPASADAAGAIDATNVDRQAEAAALPDVSDSSTGDVGPPESDLAREAPVLNTDARDDAADATGDVAVADGDDGAAMDAMQDAVAVNGSLTFVKPGIARVHTNGDLAVEIVASPESPAQVSVLVDGVVVLNLAPPFQGVFPTRNVSEGTHQLGCRAIIAGVQVICPTRTLVVDRTPPVLVTGSPSQYSYPTADTPVSAAFNEPLALRSVGDSAVEVLVDGVVVPTTASLSTDEKTVEIKLTNRPGLGQGAATVKTTVTDLAGNSLNAPATWSWRWSNVIGLGPELSALAGEAQGYDPAIAVAPDGNPVVAWSSWSQGGTAVGNRIIAQRWDGAKWTKIGAFPDAPVPNHLQARPVVAVTAAGNPIVAWHDQDQVIGTFWLRVRAWNGTAWEVWDDMLRGYAPNVVIDDAGNISLSMTVLDPVQHAAVFRRQGGAWMPLGDLMVVAGAMLTQIPTMSGDGAGNLEVFWTDQGTQQFNNVRRRRWNGTTWQILTPPPMTGAGPIAPRVAVNRGGVTGFAWTVNDGPLPQQTAVFMPGWSARVLFDGFSTGTVHDLDIDAAGRIVVTFGRVMPQTLYVQRWTGTAWEAIFDALQFSAAPESVPIGDLDLDKMGKPFLAAYDRANGLKVYVVTRLN